jgi:hypothetical protein
VLTGPGRRNEALIAASVATLRENLTEDAFIPTWLEIGTGLELPDTPGRTATPLRWIGERCPASMANAVMGWHRAQPDDPTLRGVADRLVAWFDAPGPPESAFYGPVVVDALGLLMATEFGAAEHTAVRGRIAARLAARRRASGHFGSVLETAFAAVALHAAGRLAEPEVVRRALVDAQSRDGGYPACPFYVTVGAHHEPGTYASRLVTTAVVVRALTALGARSGART